VTKYVSRNFAAKVAEIIRREGKKIVFTSGTFDIFHATHAILLEAAAGYGELFVGVNSDAAVRFLKGLGRPINREEDRCRVLEAIQAVEYVFTFDEPNNNENIRLLRPDFYIKGGDYDISRLSSSKLVEEYGGQTVILPTRTDLSTTSIINKIINGGV